MPLLGREFQLQWSGEWLIESVQGPNRPLLKEYVKLIEQRNFAGAEELYWQFYPAYKEFSDLQVPKLKIGGHPWQHMKYYQWLMGGNGGLISVRGQTLEQVGVLTHADRRAIRKVLTDLGVPITQASDDEFIVGAENARRGMSASSFTNRPFYE